CIIPLQQDAYDMYRRGELSEWDFAKARDDWRTSTRVRVPTYMVGGGSALPIRHLCIQAVTLRQACWYQYWNRFPLGILSTKALLRTLMRHLARFHPEPARLGAELRLIADANLRGESLLLNHGFWSIPIAGGPVDGRPRYELDFAKVGSYTHHPCTNSNIRE